MVVVVLGWPVNLSCLSNTTVTGTPDHLNGFQNVRPLLTRKRKFLWKSTKRVYVSTRSLITISGLFQQCFVARLSELIIWFSSCTSWGRETSSINSLPRVLIRHGTLNPGKYFPRILGSREHPSYRQGWPGPNVFLLSFMVGINHLFW